MSTAVVERTELWGAGKVAEVLGVTKHTVWRYHRRGQLPDPLEIAGQEWILVWLADDIRQWMKEHGL